MKKLLTVSLLFFNIIHCYSQGPIVTPLQSNAALANFKPKKDLKRAAGDTLKLPFFDDFSYSSLYPDPKLWLDNKVYINSHFPVSPPSYGVATFDNLDSSGKPYFPLSGNTNGPGDSLTSKPINLKNYISGVNTINYSVADSVYLSFFYQPQGLGDVSDGTDSLVLKFKDTVENWITIWKTSGSKIKPFKQILVGIKNVRYLFNGFQFTFISYSKNTGNMNQWHLDYVRMKSGRSAKDTAVADIAINAVPYGPLRWYESMPYNHFKADVSYNQLDSTTAYMRNNNVATANVNYAFQAKDQLNQILLNIPSTSSARNVTGLSDSSEKFIEFPMNALTGNKPTVTMKYSVIANSASTDNLQNNYGGNNANNDYTKTLAFRNFFAYDDGSAEGGYGLDYASIPTGPGYAATKFQSFLPDTLRGISVYFNRSVSDVSSKSFNLMAWKTISEPPANNMDNDVILKSVSITFPTYLDTLNGFVDYIFDTAVALPQGQFYIGWKQNTAYILNVGYDNNYQYQNKKDYRNPNLFFNMLGYWEKVAASITGVPMMRPIVGERVKTNIPGKAGRIGMEQAKLYPNPSNGSNNLTIESPKPVIQVLVIDLTGRELIRLDGNDIRNIDISLLSSGWYTVLLSDESQVQYKQKFIKTE